MEVMPATLPLFAVLFDLDGVLIDTLPSYKRIQGQTARHYGFTAAEVASVWSHSTTLRQNYQALQAIRPFDVNFSEFSQWVPAAVYADLKQHITGPDASLVQLLDRLRRHDIPVAVATSALRHSAQRKLALVKLDRAFQTVVTFEDITRPKPHPEVYHRAAELLGMTPARCIVIEDTATGIQAGLAAGMKVIGYSKHIADPQKLHQAHLVINDFSQLTYARLEKLING